MPHCACSADVVQRLALITLSSCKFGETRSMNYAHAVLPEIPSIHISHGGREIKHGVTSRSGMLVHCRVGGKRGGDSRKTITWLRREHAMAPHSGTYKNIYLSRTHLLIKQRVTLNVEAMPLSRGSGVARWGPTRCEEHPPLFDKINFLWVGGG